MIEAVFYHANQLLPLDDEQIIAKGLGVSESVYDGLRKYSHRRIEAAIG